MRALSSAGTSRALIVAVTAVLLPATVEAQFAFSVYLGKSSTLDCNVELHLPSGTDLNFHDVGWDDESWVNPTYYGLRFGYWMRSAPGWGVGLDFTHAKIYAELGSTVTVTGTRADAPVEGSEILADTFSELAMSHGHNTVTVNGMYRWVRGGARGENPRLTPYVAFGAGVAVPHVEVQTGDSVTHQYQPAGPTIQALGGIDLRLWERLFVFAEYRLNFARLGTDLAGGGSLRLAPWTNHFSIGLMLTLG